MGGNRLRSGYKVYDGEPAGRAQYRLLDCRRSMIDALVKELEPGQAYAIRISEWQHRYGADEAGFYVLYEFDVDIKKARSMDMVIPVMPEYHTMPWKILSLTAWEEIRRRIRNKVRFRGWFAPVSDLFSWLEKAQGWA